MKKGLLIIIIVLQVAICPAQRTIKDVLLAMPDSIIPYLNAGQKAELCKFSSRNDSLTVKNMMGGETYIDTLNSTFAQITLNEVTSIQLRLLPQNDTAQVICMVKTYSKPVADSTIKFYTTGWKGLPNTFGLPNKDDVAAMLNDLTACPDTMSAERYTELRAKLEPVIVSAELSSEAPTIKYSLSLPLLNKEEREDVQAIVRPQKFLWNGSGFRSLSE